MRFGLAGLVLKLTFQLLQFNRFSLTNFRSVKFLDLTLVNTHFLSILDCKLLLLLLFFHLVKNHISKRVPLLIIGWFHFLTILFRFCEPNRGNIWERLFFEENLKIWRSRCYLIMLLGGHWFEIFQICFHGKFLFFAFAVDLSLQKILLEFIHPIMFLYSLLHWTSRDSIHHTALDL